MIKRKGGGGDSNQQDDTRKDCIAQVYTENTSSRMCAPTPEKHVMNKACMCMYTCSVYKYQTRPMRLIDTYPAGMGRQIPHARKILV